MGSLQTSADTLGSFLSGLVSNALSAEACDIAKARIEAAKLGTCSIDVAWHQNGGSTLAVVGDLRAESEVRKILHAAADEVGLQLDEAKRTDNLQAYGSIGVSYGALRLTLMPGGTCRRVQVGTRTEPAKEVPVYEIVCDEEASTETMQETEVPE